MPGMSGVELARRAREVAPEMRLLFASGYADVDAFGQKLAEEEVVKKPYRMAELAARVEAALHSDQSAGGKSNIVSLRR